MSWLKQLFSRRRIYDDLSEEIQQHLEEKIEELVSQGVPRAEAVAAARREFGNVSLTEEESREVWQWPSLESFAADVRYGARTLRKSPAFTLIAVFTLALGIGANTAIFSLVNGILLIPLPYPDADRLVSATGAYPQGGLVAMREQVRAMDVAAYAEGHDVNLTGRGEALRLTATLVSAELFSVLNATPKLGRVFERGEDVPGQDSYVVLSHALWQQQFAADPAIVGRSIELDGVGREVVGVMPADFHFPSIKTQLWIPLHNDSRNVSTYWAGDYMPVIGRLHPGATLLQARAEISVFQSHVGALFPWPMPATWNADVTVIPLQNGMVVDVRARLLLLLAAVAMVLLIACTNVVNLTLSRTATREKEFALRAAMGAGRRRIMRQLLTESVLLGSLGGLLGLAFATEGLRLLKTLLPADTPRLINVHMDWRVLAFTGGLSIVTGLFVGFAPALQISRGALIDSLKSGGRGATVSVSLRLRSALVVGEIGLAVLLVIAAGLMIRSFWSLSHVNPGFHPEQILTARITPNESFCSNPQRCLTFYRSVLDQVRSFPGVSGAAVVNTLPLGGRVSKRSLKLENHVGAAGEAEPLFWLNIITPDYFRVMGIRVLSGRGFEESDVSGAPVAWITAETARRFWPGESAIGKHIRFVDDTNWRTIVGVISDIRAFDLQRNAPQWIDGTVYVPYNLLATLEDKRVPSQMTIGISAMDGSQVAGLLRATVANLNHEVPVSEVQTMSAVVSGAVSTPAATTSLFAAFAALALVLGVIGIYGVLSYLVSQRTREIGLRVALGAQPRDVLYLVMQEGARFSLAGIAIGVVGAFLVTRLMTSELYGVSPLDPITYLGVALVMLAVTLLACYVPTRRAMRVDPLVALRYD